MTPRVQVKDEMTSWPWRAQHGARNRRTSGRVHRARSVPSTPQTGRRPGPGGGRGSDRSRPHAAHGRGPGPFRRSHRWHQQVCCLVGFPGLVTSWSAKGAAHTGPQGGSSMWPSPDSPVGGETALPGGALVPSGLRGAPRTPEWHETILAFSLCPLL